MAKRSINIAQQDFGFPDADLKTSLHDEIVLWIKANAQKLSIDLLNWREGSNPDYIKKRESQLLKEIAEYSKRLKLEISNNTKRLKEKIVFRAESLQQQLKKQKEHLQLIRSWSGPGTPPVCKIEVHSELEVPIKRERYKTVDIVGYADIVFSIRTSTPLIYPFPTFQDERPNFDFDLSQYTRWLDGWNERKLIAFDAKSAIPSLGQLIRQLNTYRTFCSWPFVVVSPDARFEKEISDEGFWFIKYPDGSITHPKKLTSKLQTHV